MRNRPLALHKAKANAKQQDKNITQAHNPEPRYQQFDHNKQRRALNQNEHEVI